MGTIRGGASPIASLFKISWRNILRNKRRTFLTLCILTLGSTGLLVIGGFFHNIIEGFRDQYIHSQSGHLQINAKGYFRKGSADPYNYIIENLPEVNRLILSNPHVAFTVPRIKFGALVNNNNSSVAIMALGSDPIGEERMGRHKVDNAKYNSMNISEGQGLNAAKPNGTIVGKGLLETLGLEVGKNFSLIANQKSGALEGANLEVSGVFQTIVKDFDDRAMKIPFETAQKLVGMEGEAHTILVLLDRTENTELVRSELEANFKTAGLNLEVITWTETSQFYLQGKEMLDSIFRTVQFIIAIIFIFSIANTLNMSIFERIREFGTMMAIGNHRSTIFTIIFAEAIILGLLGACVGIGFGAGVAKIISAIGIEMPPPPQGSYSYYAVISLTPRLVLETFVLAILATTLSAITPAVRASRFKIIQALGYV